MSASKSSRAAASLSKLAGAELEDDDDDDEEEEACMLVSDFWRLSDEAMASSSPRSESIRSSLISVPLRVRPTAEGFVTEEYDDVEDEDEEEAVEGDLEEEEGSKLLANELSDWRSSTICLALSVSPRLPLGSS